MSAFDTAFDELIGLEGGYSDDDRDPGNWTGGKVGLGELKGTNWGVSAASYPHLDIRNLTREAAKTQVYLPDFWNAMRCDTLAEPIAKALFKFGVNEGAREAVMLLQRTLKIKQDGVMGDVTAGCAAQYGTRNLVVDFCAECALHYTKLRNFDIEGRGWLRRVVRTALESAC